jgi:hypothetical protein
MPALITCERAKDVLVCGLGWATIAATVKDRNAEIRSLAREAEADRALVINVSGANPRTAVGLLALTELHTEDEDAPRKRLHSLAAAFAKLAGEGFALLAYSVRSSASAASSEDQVAVVVVESGIPQADDVRTGVDALAVVDNYARGETGFTHRVYTNDPELFPDSIAVTDEQLWACTGRNTLLGAVPLDLKKLAAAAVLLLLAGASYFGWDQYSQQQRRLELQRQAAERDPTPKYLAFLAPKLSTLGMTRPEVQRALKIIKSYPVFVAGWTLSEVDCGLAVGGCTSTWRRGGGTTQDLLDAQKAFGDRIHDAGMGVSDDPSKVIRLIRDVKFNQSGVSSRQDLVSFASAKLATTNYIQRMENAGLKFRFESKGYSVWPSITGLNITGISSDITVRSVGVELSVEAALADSALEGLPPWIWLNGVSASVQTSTDSPQVDVKMRGNSYVR